MVTRIRRDKDTSSRYFCSEVCVDAQSEQEVVGDINGFTEKDFIQNFRMSPLLLSTSVSADPQLVSKQSLPASEWCKVCMNSDMTVQAVGCTAKHQICIWYEDMRRWPKSDFKKDLITCVLLCSYSHEKTDLSHIKLKESDLGHMCPEGDDEATWTVVLPLQW